MPKPNTSGENIQFENQAGNFGVELGGWSWGSQFGDLNNDGFLDIFLTNGYVSAEKNTSYWYDFSKVTVGNNTIIGDAANWAAMDGRSLAGFQQKKVWINDGAGKFNEVALSVGVTETFDGRAVAVADLWNRGVLDVIVANQNAPVLIYKNTVQAENNWIDLELEGTASNKSAIGTQVQNFLERLSANAGNSRRHRFLFAKSKTLAFRSWEKMQRSKKLKSAGLRVKYKLSKIPN